MRRTPGATSLPWTLASASTVILRPRRSTWPRQYRTGCVSTARAAGLPSHFVSEEARRLAACLRSRRVACCTCAAPSSRASRGRCGPPWRTGAPCRRDAGLGRRRASVGGWAALADWSASMGAAWATAGARARTRATRGGRIRIGKPPCRIKSHRVEPSWPANAPGSSPRLRAVSPPRAVFPRPARESSFRHDPASAAPPRCFGAPGASQT